MKKTLWEIISETLQAKEIDVHPPATKTGECKSNYVVVKNDGSSQISDFSSQQDYYTFMLYVPKDRYTDLSRFKSTVKEAIASNLYPVLMPTGLETPDFYDDTVKAHMVSVTYRANRRNTHL